MKNHIKLEEFESLDDSIENGSYLVLSSRYDYDLYDFPNSKTIYAVTIDDVILSVVKSISRDP
jgi:hypothetical protein